MQTNAVRWQNRAGNRQATQMNRGRRACCRTSRAASAASPPSWMRWLAKVSRCPKRGARASSGWIRPERNHASLTVQERRFAKPPTSGFALGLLEQGSVTSGLPSRSEAACPMRLGYRCGRRADRVWIVGDGRSATVDASRDDRGLTQRKFTKSSSQSGIGAPRDLAASRKHRGKQRCHRNSPVAAF